MAETQTEPQPSAQAFRLQALRNVAGIPLRELADESGFSISFLSQIENGHRRLTPEVRQKLFSALARLIGQAA